MKFTPKFLLTVGIILLFSITYSFYIQEKSFLPSKPKEILQSSNNRIHSLIKLIHFDKFKGNKKAVCFLFYLFN